MRGSSCAQPTHARAGTSSAAEPRSKRGLDAPLGDVSGSWAASPGQFARPTEPQDQPHGRRLSTTLNRPAFRICNGPTLPVHPCRYVRSIISIENRRVTVSRDVITEKSDIHHRQSNSLVTKRSPLVRLRPRWGVPGSCAAYYPASSNLDQLACDCSLMRPRPKSSGTQIRRIS